MEEEESFIHPPIKVHFKFRLHHQMNAAAAAAESKREREKVLR
jgi:hypothetical protein